MTPDVEQAVEIAFDYFCPYSRNLSGGLIAAGRSVRFSPYSLIQAQLPGGDVDLWDRPLGQRWGVNALAWAIAVRDYASEKFPLFHLSVYQAHFEHGHDHEALEVLEGIARDCGLSPSLVDIATSDATIRALRREHERHEQRGVIGVPTVITPAQSTFVRVLDDSPATAALAMKIIECTQIEELKRSVSR